MSDTIQSFNFNKHLPRWFRAIRWRDWVLYFMVENPAAHEILRLKPQTPEELEAIKRRWHGDVYHRDWDIGMYREEVAPHYDMWERRRKYPEYYAGRYEGYKRYESRQPFFIKDKPEY